MIATVLHFIIHTEPGIPSKRQKPDKDDRLHFIVKSGYNSVAVVAHPLIPTLRRHNPTWSTEQVPDQPSYTEGLCLKTNKQTKK